MDTIRSLVSKNKRRFKENGFDLDLTYIYPNIIAMGFPAEKLEGVYRNRVDDVLRFLDSRHKDHYRVYNLCDERAYDAGKFHNRVVMFPFHDHCPPPLELIEPFCKDLDSWLGSHPDNVAAIHCKAGKGRTGVMICAYMLHREKAANAEVALSYYGRTRTRDGKGVTIPSQRRYVEYYGNLKKQELKYKQRALLLSKVKFQTIPHLNNGTFNTYFDIIQKGTKIFTTPLYEPSSKEEKELVMQLQNPCMVCGDVCIEFIHRPPRLGKKERIFQCWFNTFFVRKEELESGRKYLVLSMKKEELDKANKDKDNKIYGNHFEVKFYFEYPIEGNYNSNVTRSQTDSNIGSVKKPNGTIPPDYSGDMTNLRLGSDEVGGRLQSGKHIDRNMNAGVGRSITDGDINAIDQQRTNNGSVPGVYPPKNRGGTHGVGMFNSHRGPGQSQSNTTVSPVGANGCVPGVHSTKQSGKADRDRQPPNSQSMQEFGQVQGGTMDVDKRDRDRSLRMNRRQCPVQQPGDRKGYLSPEGTGGDGLSIGDSDAEDLSDTESENEWSEAEMTSV